MEHPRFQRVLTSVHCRTPAADAFYTRAVAACRELSRTPSVTLLTRAPFSNTIHSSSFPQEFAILQSSSQPRDSTPTRVTTSKDRQILERQRARPSLRPFHEKIHLLARRRSSGNKICRQHTATTVARHTHRQIKARADCDRSDLLLSHFE